MGTRRRKPNEPSPDESQSASHESRPKGDTMVELERDVSDAQEAADREVDGRLPSGRCRAGSPSTRRREDSRLGTDAKMETSEVERLTVALAAEREQNLRLRADFDNWRKRQTRETHRLADRTRADLITQLLPVLDNFERAVHGMENGEGRMENEHSQFLRGMRMVYDQLRALLSEWGVTPMDSLGQIFDPSVHEAIATRLCEDLPEGCIVEEHERGYRFGEEILRPAKVIIAASGDPATGTQPKAGCGAG